METKIRENNAVHIPVLLKESIKLLDIDPDGIYLDCTVGLGGHSSEILKVLVKGNGMLYGIDKDEESLLPASKRLEEIDPEKKHFKLMHGSFANLKEMLEEQGVHNGQLNGVLFDLGVSSAQYDNAWRGFSYRYDAPLDMRMDLSQELDACKVVNEYAPLNLIKIFYKYGDEYKYGEDIAVAIWRYRLQEKKIETTQELEKIVCSALPAKELHRRKHPAQQVFQAIRMEVNNELGDIDKGLRSALDMLAYDGHLVIITFHSIEDKFVKDILKEYTDFEGDRVNDFRTPDDYVYPEYIMERKKVIYPSKEEVEKNNRARSSKLRVVKRIRRY